jgi:hypothetical protein
MPLLKVIGLKELDLVDLVPPRSKWLLSVDLRGGDLVVAHDTGQSDK